jgi:hypothetical protein
MIGAANSKTFKNIALSNSHSKLRKFSENPFNIRKWCWKRAKGGQHLCASFDILRKVAS